MTEDYDFESELEVEYYLFDGTVARLWYDVEADEYTDGEILDQDGQWEQCPVYQVLSDGQEISYEEAGDRVRALGGRI
jgi:hypothetical protein